MKELEAIDQRYRAARKAEETKVKKERRTLKTQEAEYAKRREELLVEKGALETKRLDKK